MKSPGAVLKQDRRRRERLKQAALNVAIAAGAIYGSSKHREARVLAFYAKWKRNVRKREGRKLARKRRDVQMRGAR